MSAVLQTKSKLPSFLNILLVVILGILASKLMWLIITPENELDLKEAAVDIASSTAKKSVNYGKIIANQHLFGKIKIAKVTKPVTPKPVVKKPVVVAPKLNLKLHGIVSYKQNEGLALISSNNGPQKVYGEGEEIQQKVKVVSILPDKVVLSNHGKNEDLRLPVKSNAKTSKNTKRNFPATSSRPKKRTNASRKTPKVIPAAEQLDLGAFRQEVVANPGKIMDVARPSPAVVNGKFIGFRLQPGTKRKLFRKLGFRPNDIITEVNGIVLDDPNKGPMVLAELSQASSLSVKVKRGEEVIYIDESF